MNSNRQRTCLATKSMMILFAFFFMYACSMPREQDALLQSADSLMKSRPDSALVLLESISPDRLSTLADRAKYALLLTQAQDKNYIVHTNDSLIRIAVNYYDSIGDNAWAAKAHYYLARVYQETDNPRATVTEFLLALHLAEKGKDLDLTILLQSNLGKTLFNQGLNKQADSLYACAIELAEQKRDSVRLASMYMMQGKINLERGALYYNVAEERLVKAYRIAEVIHVNPIKESVYSTMSSLYSRMQNSEKAISFAKLALDIQTDSLLRCDYYLKLGDAYYKALQYDSAIYYLDKSLLTNDCYIKSGAYMRLADIAEEQKRVHDVLQYRNLSFQYKDSASMSEYPTEIVSTLKDSQIHQVSSQYESFFSYYRYGIVGLLLTGILCFFYLRKKHHHKVDTLIEEHHTVKRKINEMTAELDEKEQELARHQKLYLHNLANHVENEKLRERIKKITEERDKLAKAQLASTMIYTKLLQLKEFNMQNPDNQKLIEDVISWGELRTVTNSIFSQFADRLSNQYELLREDDLLLCSLMKCGFKYAEIANLLACTPNAVYKRRETIVTRLKQPLTADQFVKFIQEF